MPKMFYFVIAGIVVAGAFAAFVLGPESDIPAPPQAVEEETPTASLVPPAELLPQVEGRLADLLADKVMGRTDAPVTIIEYSSLTCPHCATFHLETLPKIDEAYIATGKVRLIYRDYPLDSLALAAAMVARCAGTRKYFGMLEILFRNQKTWARSSNPVEEIERMARFAGMSKADVGGCLNDAELMEEIQQRAKAAGKAYAFDSTPTFFIGGQRVSGAEAFEVFQGVIDTALGGGN